MRDYAIRAYHGVPSNDQFPFLANNHDSKTNPALVFDAYGPACPFARSVCDSICLVFEAMVHDANGETEDRLFHDMNTISR